MKDRFDSPWKEILDAYFGEFLEFFFPQAHRDIDWQHGYKSLDTELQKIVRDAETGKRLADKLMKVVLRDGRDQIVLVHVEVQGDYDGNFAHRMYTYNYRLFDKYQGEVVSLAILGDESTKWRPKSFGYDRWECRLAFQFPIVKLWDYNDRRQWLESQDNPFARVVLAHLGTRATRNRPEDRLRVKTNLLRRLYKGGYERDTILELFRFIDWLMALPVELEDTFQQRLEGLEKELSMRYITTIERKGIEKGLAQGIEQGLQRGLQQGIERGLQRGVEKGLRQGVEKGLRQGQTRLLHRMMDRRFGDLPSWVDDRLRHADDGQLALWADRLIDAEQLADVFGDRRR